MNLRKACEHDLYDSHRFERKGLPGEEFTFEELTVLGWHVCPGGTEPTVEELVAELERRDALILNYDGQREVFLPRTSAAPYDIEIPDFVNRHGTW